MKYLFTILLTFGCLFAFSQPTGSVFQYGGKKAPEGYLILKGQPLFIGDYPELFDVIGYRYGGKGILFNLPNPKKLLWATNGFEGVESKTIVRTDVRTGSGTAITPRPRPYRRLNYIIKL